MDTISTNSRSDKLLLVLSGRLSKTSLILSEAVLVWQGLIQAEHELENLTKGIKKPKDYKIAVERAYKQCRDLAFDLREKYEEAMELLGFKETDQLKLAACLKIPIQRLFADYGPAFQEGNCNPVKRTKSFEGADLQTLKALLGRWVTWDVAGGIRRGDAMTLCSHAHVERILNEKEILVYVTGFIGLGAAHLVSPAELFR